MLDAASAVPAKSKRRKLSAVRNFPQGCRALAPKEETTRVVVSRSISAGDDTRVRIREGAMGVEEFEGRKELKEEIPRIVVPESVNAGDDARVRIRKEEAKGVEKVVEEFEGRKELEEETPCIVVPESVNAGDDALVRIRKEEAKGVEKVVEEFEGRKELKENGSNGNGEWFCSRRYRATKRRKVSAVRHFPGGCVRNAPKVGSKELTVTRGTKLAVGVGSSKEEEVMNVREVEGGDRIASASPEPKSFDGENLMAGGIGIEEEGVRTEPINEEVREPSDEPKINREASDELPKLKNANGKVIFDSPKPNDLDGDTMVKSPEPNNLEGEAMVKSPELNNMDVRDMIELPKPMHSDGEGNLIIPKLKNSYVDVMVNSPTLINFDGEEAMVELPTSEDLNEDSNVESPKLKNSEGEAMIKSPQSKDLDAEKRAITNLQIVEEVSMRGSSAELEVKTSDSKQIKEKDATISDKARVKSPLSSSTGEEIVEEHHEKKILKIYTREKKMKGTGVKQVSKSHQVKQESEVNRPSGAEVVDNGGRSSRGKHVVKLSTKGPTNNISPKRKLAEEIDDKNHVCQDEESMEASADRLVVQALMSAENCPWRKGKKSAGTRSRSATPKFKAKCKQKLPTKSLAFKGLSNSQHNDEDLEDEEDTMFHEDGNEKALVVFKQSRELSITLPPCVPPNLNYNGASSEGASARAVVKKSLRLFQWITRKFLRDEEARPRDNGRSQRVDLKAASILKESNYWVNYGGPILGDVPGVEVGDEFHFRVELAIIGIHRPFQGGIDYMKRDDGVILALSIVASGGYPDDIDSSDVLIYSGSGGTAVKKDQQAGDQKLERGNLALKNSIDAKTPVRVVYGFKEQLKGNDSRGAKTVLTYTYDGLYVVEKYWPEKGPNGFSVFKFQLRRMLGQPEIALKEVKKSKKSKIREGLVTKDISNGKETIPICLINTVDNENPMPFKYTTEVIYPSSYLKKPPTGCDCTSGCRDFSNCTCVTKNGGEIPYNYNGDIVQAKTLVYECGPSCKCPPSCPNRVSQHGIRIPLEIFKTERMGWGVRSLYSIPSGSFICEYVGEMLQDTEAEQRSNDEYLFDIGSNYDDHALWEGLPNPIPCLESNSIGETVDSDGFTIDAAEYGNVGRFINHSCSPNLYAQNVLYDHDDKRIPHIMFFAADNIPPLQELTYHYNYSMDQVRDAQGNVKRKDCFCGSPECTGRLY